jgi:ABC-type Na+ efflux pump permease subunit
MRLSLQATIIAGVVFALVCFGVAIHIFTSVTDIADPAQASDARGFAGFWAFLGLVASFFAGLSWWLIRGGASEPPPR